MSRRFVAATETALSGLLAAPLHGVELVALMFDGVRFGGLGTTHPILIGIDARKRCGRGALGLRPPGDPTLRTAHPGLVQPSAVRSANTATGSAADGTLVERWLDSFRNVRHGECGTSALEAAAPLAGVTS